MRIERDCNNYCGKNMRLRGAQPGGRKQGWTGDQEEVGQGQEEVVDYFTDLYDLLFILKPQLSNLLLPKLVVFCHLLSHSCFNISNLQQKLHSSNFHHFYIKSVFVCLWIIFSVRLTVEASSVLVLQRNVPIIQCSRNDDAKSSIAVVWALLNKTKWGGDDPMLRSLLLTNVENSALYRTEEIVIPTIPHTKCPSRLPHLQHHHLHLRLHRLH